VVRDPGRNSPNATHTGREGSFPKHATREYGSLKLENAVNEVGSLGLENAGLLVLHMVVTDLEYQERLDQALLTLRL